MSFLGNKPDSFSYASTSYDHFSGTGSQTVYTLSRGVSANADISVTVGNVVQDPGVAYYVSNLNTLTFTGAPVAGSNNIVVVYRQYVQSGIAPGANTITSTQIAANTIQPYHLSTSLLVPVVNGFTGTGSNTVFTLSANAVSSNTCEVTVNGLVQSSPVHYSVVGNVLTFTSAPALNAVIRVSQNGIIGTQVVPLDGSITTSKFVAGSVTAPILAANSVTSAALAPALNVATMNVTTINAFTGNSALTIDNNGNLGLGATSMDTTYNKNFTISGTNTSVLKMGNATTGIGAAAGFDIGMLDPSNKSNAFVYNRQNAPIIFGTNNAEAARFNASGTLLFAQSGQGVQFTNSSALTNSVLNDYETGTWTPTLTFGGGSTGIVYGAQQGGYVKVGRMVTATCYVYITSKGSSTGVINVNGLPFSTSSSTDYWIPLGARNGFNLGSGVFPFQYVGSSSSTIVLYTCNLTTGGSPATISSSAINPTTEMSISITYQASF